MRTIQNYLDLAIENSKLTSSNHLARSLNCSSAYVSQLRQGKALPSDEMMVHIAKLAGVPLTDALLELRVWNTAGEAQDAYKDLIKRLKVTAIAAAIAISGFSPKAIAATSPVTSTASYCILWVI